MSENRFAYCATGNGVLIAYRKLNYVTIGDESDALARIRELTPPTVSEEARERAGKVLESAFGYALANPYRADVLDRIIDALGYTPTATTGWCNCTEPEAANIVHRKDGLCYPYDPAPASPPVVELAPDELRWLAAVVEDYEKLYNDASRVVDDDTLPPMYYLHLRDSRQSVRVVCGENCWVLRIGGTDE